MEQVTCCWNPICIKHSWISLPSWSNSISSLKSPNTITLSVSCNTLPMSFSMWYFAATLLTPGGIYVHKTTTLFGQYTSTPTTSSCESIEILLLMNFSLTTIATPPPFRPSLSLRYTSPFLFFQKVFVLITSATSKWVSVRQRISTICTSLSICTSVFLVLLL